MAKTSAKEYIEFYSYWLANYRMRNEAFSKEFAAISAMKKNLSEHANKVNELNAGILLAMMEARLAYSHDKLAQPEKMSTAEAEKIKKWLKGIQINQEKLDAELNKIIPKDELDSFVKDADTVQGFYKKYDIPRGYNFRKDNPDDMLKCLENRLPIDKSGTSYHVKHEAVTFDKYEIAKKLATDGNTCASNPTIFLDFDYEQIKLEFDLYYYQTMSIRSMADNCNTKERQGCSLPSHYFQKANNAAIELTRYKIKKNPTSSFKVDDTPRAVGLWIWDYLTNKHGRESLPRGALTEAVKELKNRFNIKTIGYADSSPKVLEDKYRGTCQCIEACEVIPF